MTKEHQEVIYKIHNFSDDQLKKALRELSRTKQRPSLLVLDLFNIVSDDNWLLGLDRFNFINKCVEHEILERIRLNKM
jgi:hypothetical protein